MTIGYACTCHETRRTVSFTSSLIQPKCWCGLLSVISSGEDLSRAEVPVILNAKFWKSPKEDIIHYYPQLKSLLICEEVGNKSSYLYFLSNYLIGYTAGYGTFSKVRKGLMQIGRAHV